MAVMRPMPAGAGATRTVPPGSTLGMVGGGQLGRMFALTAARMGYPVRVFCQDASDPAAQVAPEVVTGSLRDEALAERFARGCAVITLEFENLPASTIAACGRHAPTYPSASVLQIAQDRLLEKATLRDAGLPVTPFAEVGDPGSPHDPGSLRRIGAALGWPLIVKTARSGYDGKGQYRVASPQDAEGVPWETADRWVAEARVDFDRELSVIVARTPSGRTETFPVFENVHVNHILDATLLPAGVPDDVAGQARRIAIRAAEQLQVVGLLCVEFFCVGERLMINEVAPRPHNSGHVTIEACATSQFEQQLRAICDLPLGSTRLIAGGAAMVNLLGDLWPEPDVSPRWDAALGVEGVRLHLYGKRATKAGRKMGHMTSLGDDPAEALRRVRMARDRCRGRD